MEWKSTPVLACPCIFATYTLVYVVRNPLSLATLKVSACTEGTRHQSRDILGQWDERHLLAGIKVAMWVFLDSPHSKDYHQLMVFPEGAVWRFPD